MMAESDTPSVEELTQKLIMAEEVSKGLLLDHQAEKEEMIMRMKALEEMVQSLAVTARGGDQPEYVAPAATGGGGDSAQHTTQPNTGNAGSLPQTPQTNSINIPVVNDEANRQISVQVEHIIRGDRDMSQLRPFSGNRPRNGEVSFDEWSKQVEVLLDDDTVSNKHKKQRMLSSLHSLAVDLARSMGDIPPRQLFASLEGLYGTTCNGVKLLQEFFTLHIEPHEAASDYLQCLSVKLGSVQRKGGVQSSQVNETILTHFKATCNDDRICHVLHVEFDNLSPPTLHELMREVKRVEEDFARRQRRDAPPARPPPRVYHQSHRVEDNSGLKQLREEVSKWQQEISGTLDSMKATLDRDMRREPRPATTQARQVGPTYRFCYNCGKYGHMSPVCRSPPNPELVHKKLMERANRRMPVSHDAAQQQQPRPAQQPQPRPVPQQSPPAPLNPYGSQQ